VLHISVILAWLRFQSCTHKSYNVLASSSTSIPADTGSPVKLESPRKRVIVWLGDCDWRESGGCFDKPGEVLGVSIIRRNDVVGGARDVEPMKGNLAISYSSEDASSLLSKLCCPTSSGDVICIAGRLADMLGADLESD
jgi:hypothetical protein